MAKSQSTVALSDLEHNAPATLKQVKKSKRLLVVTERGKVAAVLLSVDVCEKSRQEREILTLVTNGEREIAAGKGYDLEDVL